MFLVCLQSASGRKVEMRVRATSSTSAIKAAMGEMPEADGFLPVWALEA